MTPFEHDKTGKSYGSVDGSGVVFGPHGTITTTQPLIIRRPTVGGEQTYNQTETGTTHGLRDFYGVWGGVSSVDWKPGGNTGQTYAYYLEDHEDVGADAFQGQMRFAPKVTWGLHTYMMNGPYNVSAEDGYHNEVAGNYRLIEIIEGAVSTLKNPNWRYRFAIEQPYYSDNSFTLHQNDHLADMPFYNPFFHDYS